MLLGFRDSTSEVGSVDQGKNFISVVVYHKAAKFIFEYIGVYGPANHTKSIEFLEEIEAKVARSQHPVVVVGTPDYPSGIPNMHTICDPMTSVS
jgi:hypothetical protein